MGAKTKLAPNKRKYSLHCSVTEYPREDNIYIYIPYYQKLTMDEINAAKINEGGN